MTKTVPRRGEVYLVQFDPAVGAEIQKTRPALIIQNDISNKSSEITIVAACTSRTRAQLYPTEVVIRAGEGGLHHESVILLNQVRSVDKHRLIRRLGKVGDDKMESVDKALTISLAIAHGSPSDRDT